jgi:lipopolysaccharide/colanic/teichoic acid biosynthesis glycosyltransferase
MHSALSPKPEGSRPATSLGTYVAGPPVHPGSGVYRFGKRLLDFSLALGLFIVTLPLMLLAMLLVKLTSRGPAVYSQVRLGRDGVPFVIYKIRTMRQDAEGLTGASWSRPGDARITPVGRWLRKTHLDELPQLWNVLCGSMSLVGPRPERPEFLPQLEQAIPRYRDRLLVLPGVTGLAQVQLPPDTDLGSVRLKLAYDLEYVAQLGLWLDLRICWATALKMAGVSFERIGRLFLFRDQETIVARYKALAAEVAPRRTTQGRHDQAQGSELLDSIGS